MTTMTMTTDHPLTSKIREAFDAITAAMQRARAAEDSATPELIRQMTEAVQAGRRVCDEADVLLDQYFAITSAGLSNADPLQAFEADSHSGPLRKDRMRLTLATDAGDAVLREMRRARCAVEVAELSREYRKDLAEFDKALTHAARINARIAARDEQMAALAGMRTMGYSDRWAWIELFDETPTFQSRLASWRRAARAAGVL